MYPGSSRPADAGEQPRWLLSKTSLRTACATALATLLGMGSVVVGAAPAHAAAGALSITDVTAAEDDSLVFELRREGGGTIPALSLTYSTVAVTATANADFTPVSGTLTFPATSSNNPQVQRITVKGVADALDEDDETFKLQFVNPDDPDLNNNTFSAQGTLRDDDATPSYSLTADNPVAENIPSGHATITATLSAVSGRDITIPVSTANGTAIAGQDYAALGGGAQITIPAGATSRTVNVDIIDDLLDEADTQSFDVVGGTGTNVVGTGSVTVDITDNEAMPVVRVAGAGTAAEGGTLTFPVSLSAASERAVTVRADTADGTATAASDYSAVTGQTVTIAAGQTSNTVTVTTTNDALNEADETFSLVLSAPVNATLADPATADGTITDDDAPPTVTLTPVTVTEGSDGTSAPKTFTATLSGASGRPVTVGYDVSGGTATAGTDYTATSGTLTIPAGEVTKTFTVDVKGDTVDEPDETFNVILSNSDGTVGAGGDLGTTAVTITDDDAKPTFTIADKTVLEKDGPHVVQMTVTLSNPSANPIDLAVSAANGTAVDAASYWGSDDYDTPATTVTVPALATTATIDVPVNGDEIFEDNETLTVTVDVAPLEADATAGADSATLTLTNDDLAPTFTISSESGVEGSSAAVILTQKHGMAQEDTHLRLAVNGASVAGSDPAEPSDFVNPGVLNYVVPGGTYQGESMAVTTFRFNNDFVDENTETVVVTGSDVADNSDVTSGVQRINDDPGDLPPTVNLGDVTVGEAAGPATVPVDLSFDGDTTSTERDVVVGYYTSNGTARAGYDYTATSGYLTFQPGHLHKQISVPVLNDTLDEPNQQFTVNVGSLTPAETPKGQTTATVTITDNDDTAAPTLTAPSFRYGVGAVSVSGTASEGATVTLFAAPGGGGSWRAVGTTTPSVTGQYSFSYTISTGHYFAVRANGVQSRTVPVYVKQAPTLALSSPGKGQVRAAVTGNPRRGGVAVTLQRANSNGTWTTVGRATTNAYGNAYITLRSLRSGSSFRYRAWVNGIGSVGILGNYSANRVIRVK